MIANERQITPWAEIVDESFSTSGNYDLYMIGGKGLFSFLLIDTDRNKFVVLKDFTFVTQTELPSLIEKVYEDNRVYFEAASKAVFCFAGNNFTIVPGAFYSDEEKDNIFLFNNELKTTELILTDSLRLPDTKIIYSAEKNVVEYLQSLFSKIEFHHSANPFIEGIFSQHKNYDEKIVTINVYHSFFELAVTSGRNLILFNRFSYQNPEDFIYFILFACEQLNLNPESVQFYFSGMIEKNSALYLLAQKYIRHSAFARRPDFCDYSYKFDEIPGHLQFTAYNMYLCAS